METGQHEERPGYETWEQVVGLRKAPNVALVPVPEADLTLILVAALPMMEELRGRWYDNRVDRELVRAWWESFESLTERDQKPILDMIYSGRHCLIAHVDDDVDV